MKGGKFMSDDPSVGLTRRDVLRLGALAGAGASLAPLVTSSVAANATTAPSDFNEMTITQLQGLMGSRQARSVDLVTFFLQRIRTLDQSGPMVNSVIELNPDALAIASALDGERQAGHVRGPLHGIPVLLKDNVDTHDQMQTAAGSLALVGTPALQDSTVAARLRAAGAVILGKTTLSEWANFRSFFSSSGWSGRGGQCNNPYAIDRNPCGSSSGSGAAASAGKFHRDYTQFLDPNGVSGVRIGVAREYEGVGSPHTDAVFEDALSALHGAGAILVDVSFPHLDEINSGGSEFTVLLNDFKHDLNAYLSTRTGVPITSLADAIAFNNAHAAQEMPFFAQELFDLAQTFSGDLSDPAYLTALARDKVIGGSEGIDAILATNNVQAIVAPTDTPAWPTDLINADHFVFGSSSAAAIVGYPIVVVPMGFSFGLPLGLSIMGTAFSEPTLIKIASGFEHASQARRAPKFFATLPFNTKGMPTPTRVHRRRNPAGGRVAPVRI